MKNLFEVISAHGAEKYDGKIPDAENAVLPTRYHAVYLLLTEPDEYSMLLTKEQVEQLFTLTEVARANLLAVQCSSNETQEFINAMWQNCPDASSEVDDFEDAPPEEDEEE